MKLPTRRQVGPLQIPRFIYGTAWKEDATEALVVQALAAGFVGLDTANQRKHYHERGVGRALATTLSEGPLHRDQLFIQSKFTFVAGQDHRLPYDPAAPIATQVAQSCTSSLEHLGIDKLDGYLLHGPSRARGLGPEDLQAWAAMEALHGEGKATLLGASNVSAPQLELLCAEAKVMPALVQNRCFASTGFDAEVRQVCARHGIAYQGFSLLTANQGLLGHPAVARIAARHQATPAQILFRIALELDIIALTGTRSTEHMAHDLAVFDIALGDDELRAFGIEPSK